MCRSLDSLKIIFVGSIGYLETTNSIILLSLKIVNVSNDIGVRMRGEIVRDTFSSLWLTENDQGNASEMGSLAFG